MEDIIIKTPQGNRNIGPGQPVFIVAELSGNHHQDLNQALKLIDVAAQAGVDAVKIQTYTPDTITIDVDNKYFRIKGDGDWSGQTLYQLYHKAYTPWDWQPKLKDYAQEKGLVLFSTPFDSTAVDFLEKMRVELYKVASYEVTDIPLLKKIGQTNKPVIISRGLATESEIDIAITTLKDSGCPQVAVLHCILSYPPKTEDMNLITIADIAKKFDVISGLSDHGLDNTVDILAVGLGASIIEKHITLSRADGGPDAKFSLEPAELRSLVSAVRLAQETIGKPTYQNGESGQENIIFRKSIFVVEDIKQGEKFSAKNIRVIRPGHGLAPKYYEEIIGKTAKLDIKKGTPLAKELIE